MKKYYILALIPFLASCSNLIDIHKGQEDFLTYMFNMKIDSTEFEDYYGINDTETKIFNDLESLSSFDQLIKDKVASSEETYCFYDEFFNEDVDFSEYKVAVTAMYAPHTSSNFTLSSIVKGNKSITLTINQDIRYPGTSSSSIGFLYTIIEKSIDLPIKSNFIVERNYNQFVAYKPIIYFYPEKEMDLDIYYKYDERLITTYPKYNDGWHLSIHEDGTFNVRNEARNYYALYFDEYNYFQVDFSKGFYVTKENAIDFLEEKLTILGFNERESNEFIMYWLPVLEENESSLVYFEQTDERNEECPLEFSTNPDTLLRTIIHVKKVDKEVSIKPQKLETVNRQGFSIIEWGGIKY